MTVRQHFQEALREMNQDVLKLGTLVEEALRKAVRAFQDKDTEAAEQIIRDDDQINNMQLQLEDRCVVLIATEQPVATDLRRLMTSVKIVSNLERIGDHAVHMARATIRLKDETYIKPIINRIPQMAEIGITMVHEALTAFINADVDKAVEISKRDDELDEMHAKVFSDLTAAMMSDANTVLQATSLLLIIRFLERLGDHVTNICEWIVFSNTGKHVELNR
jgi:phosphate transport system protein